VFGEELSPEELAKETNNFIRAQAKTLRQQQLRQLTVPECWLAMRCAELQGQHLPSIREHVREEVAAQRRPEHEKWTLPGGDNYREMLIKPPKRSGRVPRC